MCVAHVPFRSNHWVAVPFVMHAWHCNACAINVKPRVIGNTVEAPRYQAGFQGLTFLGPDCCKALMGAAGRWKVAVGRAAPKHCTQSHSLFMGDSHKKQCTTHAHITPSGYIPG